MSSPAMRVASAPVSFGVDEILMDDDWMPDARRHARLDGRHRLRGDRARHARLPRRCRRRSAQRLSSRGLEFIGSFLPQHFSRAEKADEDRAWLRDNLRLVRDGAPAGLEAVRDPVRPVRRAGPARFSGRIAGAPRDVAVGGPLRRRSSTTSIGPPSCAGRRASSRSSIPTPARTSRRPTRSPGSWTGSTRRSSGCASTPATSGSAGPTRPGRSTTTTTSSATSTSRTAGRRSWPT